MKAMKAPSSPANLLGYCRRIIEESARMKYLLPQTLSSDIKEMGIYLQKRGWVDGKIEKNPDNKFAVDWQEVSEDEYYGEDTFAFA